MLDNLKGFIADKSADAAAAVGESFEKLIPESLFQSWHSFTHKMFITIIVVIVALILVNTVFDSVRRIIRGLDVAAVGGVFLWGSTKIPDIVFIRELAGPLQKIGLALFAVGIVLFLAFRIIALTGKKAINAVKNVNSDSKEAAAVAPAKSGMRIVVAALLALAVGIGSGIVVDQFVINKPEPTKVSSEAVYEVLTEISEMATLKEDYHEITKYKGDPKTLFGKNVPFTNKSMELEFSGTIKAGPDLSKATIDVDQKNNKITIVLPKSKILSHEVIEDSIQILGVKNGVFNRISLENNNEARQQGKEAKQAAVLETDFLEQADANAVTQYQEMLSKIYPDMEIIVRVK